MKIEKAEKQEYETLIEIWEASVRATHDFLQEDDIAVLKPLILNEYFDAVDLRCAKDDTEKIHGFCGVHEGNVQVLFISPESRGKGVGFQLMKYAIENQGATKVDVNEQNKQALGFYEHLGFNVVGRSPLDGQGRPYPLLHMELGKI
ncbi:MAG: acetyltransferase [Pseudomonadota bacterium]